MRAALIAGLLYFAIVFAVGFMLGTVRVMVVAPKLGLVPAVLIELPVLLTAAWFTSRALIKRWQVPALPAYRLLMGLCAFSVLMLAEFSFAVGVFGQPVQDYFAEIATPHGALGLAGQIAFGLWPRLQTRG